MTNTIAPTPTDRGIPFKPVNFKSFPEALDYAAEGATGVNFFSSRGKITERLTYTDLRTQSLELAKKLIVAGLQPGDRIAILAESEGDFLRAFGACQYANMIPVPLPLPGAFRGRAGYIDQVSRMIAAAKASAAFGMASMQSWLEEATAGLGLKFACSVGDLPERQDDVTLPDVDTDGIAYLQFSSGSTRFPLGVAVTHDAFIANTQAIARHGMSLRPEDRCTTWLPFYHDLGLVGCLLTPVVTQMSIDILPTREFVKRPMNWLSMISEHGGTLSFGPTFCYELCLRRARTAPPSDSLDLSAWRSAGIGGDMVRPGILRQFADTFRPYGFSADAFTPSYGMAEATVAVSFHEPGLGLIVDTVDLDRLEDTGDVIEASEDTPRQRSFVHCGKVLPGHEIEVRDENGNVLPDYCVGRFFLRGPSVMQGYFGHPEETAAVLAADGWLDTGDLGYLADGDIVITGRAKDMIIVNGRNIWPQDLEWTVEREVEATRSGDVAAFSVEAGDEEKIVVLVQSRSKDEEARHDLRTEVENLLSGSHGVQCDVVLIPHNTLPHTSSGKLSRARSRQLYLNGVLADDHARDEP